MGTTWNTTDDDSEGRTDGVSPRDRAVLRAVAAGRCQMTGHRLLVDGRDCSDQFLGRRLQLAGLITADGAKTVALTRSATALLTA
jgi:hypothetical protein